MFASIRLATPVREGWPVSVFGQVNAGYCFINQDIRVYSRPAAVIDPGPWEYRYSIGSQNELAVSLGLGLTVSVTKRIGIDVLPRYSIVFTDEESIKYRAITGGLTIRI